MFISLSFLSQACLYLFWWDIAIAELDIFLDILSSFFVLKIAELDGLEADMEFESAAVPSYLQPDEEADLNLPAAPTYPTAVPVNRHQVSEFHVHVQKNAICTAFLT
jgi:hypothetical protein